MARFANLNLDEVNVLLSGTYSKNTLKSTNVAWNTFVSYCREKGVTIEVETCSKSVLDGLGVQDKTLI